MFLDVYYRDMYDKLTPTENTNQYETIMRTGIQILLQLIKNNKMALIKNVIIELYIYVCYVHEIIIW